MAVWEEKMKEIAPISDRWMKRAKERLDNLVKPRGSLGVLEDLAGRYAAIREEIPITLPKKEVFIFVGDHDVVRQGVSAYPQEVTALMVNNFLAGGAAINVLARCARADVSVVDIGMKEKPSGPGALIERNVRRGARDIASGPAMTREETEKAIGVGIEMADRAFKGGTTLIATGEMGIGNTTPASAILSCLLPSRVVDVTGRGTGLDDHGLERKVGVIEKAIKVHEAAMGDPLSILSRLGGFEIAGICGLCLGGAANRMAVVVDGFISSAGALVAMRLNPKVREYLFFSHQSLEKGHRVFFAKEGIRPILDLDLRLGEGTGAAVAMQIMEDAFRVFNEMATFEDVGIAPGA
jgi:nicotinate-nucleotide--dimethylbenzimidazole phosphoribosyltransferase